MKYYQNFIKEIEKADNLIQSIDKEINDLVSEIDDKIKDLVKECGGGVDFFYEGEENKS